MDQQNDQLLGYCGLFCGNCLYYQNTERGTGTDMGNGTFIMCKGCNSDQPSPWCIDCELKTCCRNQDIRTCIECGEYPCDTLAVFIHNSEYPYHRDVPGMMARLMEVGLAAWAEEMDRQYTCDICGEKFSYFDGKCPRCADQ